MKKFRYLDIITVFFVVVLLISNIASTKIGKIGFMTLDGGTILFPLTYIFDDILTEVYGYKNSRRTIWLGFGSLILMSLVFLVVGILPPADGWENQDAYMKILGLAPRIALGSLCAYWIGEFANSYALAKMKIFTNGRMLWTRTIGSTMVGELLDSLIFVSIAFVGILPTNLLIDLIIFNYIFKTGMEILFTPITYLVVNKLKRVENEDYYDRKTDFNPFKLEI